MSSGRALRRRMFSVTRFAATLEVLGHFRPRIFCCLPMLLLSLTLAFGQNETPNIGLKRAAPGSANADDAVSSNADKLDSILSGKTPIPGLVVKRFNNKLYADQFADSSHTDVGSQVNAAIAALPVIQGVPTGIVSLEGYQGVQSLRTTIQLTSHSVSLVGPGKASLTLECAISNGDCIRIKDDSWGKGGMSDGPYVTGFSLVGHGTPGTVAMRIGDIYPLHLQDIFIFGFNGSNSTGIWFQNLAHFTEQLNMTDVRVSNNRVGMRYTNDNGTDQTLSFGYGTYTNVFVQLGAGQTGIVIDGGTSTTFPLIYHSHINWIFEDLRYEPGQTNTFISMADNSAMMDNVYAIFIEDQGGNNGPWLKMGNNSVFTGFGQIQSWGRSVSLGKNVIFNVSGKVEIQGADWSPVAGRIALDPGGKWGSGASVDKISGHWQLFSFTVTAGSNPQPNPRVAINFPDPNGQTTWRNPPLYMCKQVGGTGGVMIVTGEDTASRNAMYLDYHGTPSQGATYVVNCYGNAR